MQLGRLRSSPLFSHSRRCPIFLDYVVRKTLDGQSDQLKERIVSVEAFGRPASYYLNPDPLVRVTAREVRKRLAQYDYQHDHQHKRRIDLSELKNKLMPRPDQNFEAVITTQIIDGWSGPLRVAASYLWYPGLLENSACESLWKLKECGVGCPLGPDTL